jgi:hypothetical protein
MSKESETSLLAPADTEVLFYGEQQKFPQIGANPLFMQLAIPLIGTK